MAESFSFLQQNRPDIGLVDRYDLSEIYDSDERLALTNLLLEPEGLDQIYGLVGKGITKEDVRTAGGLDKPIIHSVGISSWTLGDANYSLLGNITTDKAIGEPGKQSFVTDLQSDNIIVFQGGLAAKKIEYSFLDENGGVRTTTVPTSRESLFGASKDGAGAYTSASYPGLFRIRKRSHLHELRLSSKLLIERSSIVESPTDTLKIPVYMRTSTNTSPSVTNLQCYATKNSPLVLPVRIFGGATLSFSRVGANSSSPAFVYGWELKRLSDLRLARSEAVQSSGAVNTVNINVSTSGTICNGVDALLYVYLDPSVVVAANLSGLGMTEQAGRDLGLIGFTSLEDLNISNNNFSTLPVWLKTLHSKLKKLNISGNAFWLNGIVSYFDWQEPPVGVTGASSAGAIPNITLAQVLGYSGWTNSGAITAYGGNLATAQDSAGTLYKNQRNISVNGGTAPVVDIANGFRPFILLEELNLGPTVRLTNPDFTTLFPNLRSLNINTGGSSPRVLYGLIPKLKNNNSPMSLGLSGHYGEVNGSIRYLGNTITWNTADSGAVKQQFIGQFKFSGFDINNGSGAGGWFGGICTTDADLGVSIPNITVDGIPKYSFVGTGTAAQAWSGWLAETQYLGIYYRDMAFRIANGTSLTWAKLNSVNCTYCGVAQTSNKTKYNTGVGVGTMLSDDILQAPNLGGIDAWYSGWWGKIFSISGAPNLSYANLGANNWEPYETSDGRQYLLPENFVAPATATSYNTISALYLHSIFNGWARNMEFRPDDLKDLPRVSTFYVGDSYLTGAFPTVFTANNTAGVGFNTWIHNCRFRDLSALGSTNTNRVGLIYGPSNGTGVGGSLLPNFKTTSVNQSLSYVCLDSTLSQRYPGNWGAVADRGKLIAPLVTGALEENTPGVTWTSRNNNNTSDALSDKLYQSNPGGFRIDSQAMVGDEVYSGTSFIGRVTQIDRDNLFLYIDAPVSVTSASLTFRRAGQNISEFFNNHVSLDQVYIRSAKLTGTIPLFTNCRALRFVYLDNNLLSEYQSGTLKNITGMSTGSSSPPPLLRFMLEGNVLTKESVKRIINDVHDIAVYFRTKNIRPNFIVNILSTKYNSANKEYQNWTRGEIFDQTSTYVNAAGETVTVPDPLETKFNQLGVGNTYSTITIQLF